VNEITTASVRASSPRKPPADAPYRDASLALSARVLDVLARMTLEEKVAQLGSAWSFQLVDDRAFDRGAADRELKEGIGEITRLAGGTNLLPADVARVGNEIQRYLLEETRLGIPAIVHEESLHGLLARDAPVFQQAIGAAASFDPGIHAAAAATIRRRMLATGARHTLAPVLDIARDPRWGRIEETYGEDPYLAAVMGAAYIRAVQGEDLGTGTIATGKHLVGHGLAEGGRNQSPVHAGARELRDEQLFAFEVAVRQAGLRSMMPAYCDVDGVPCHASRWLLTDVLRGEWGFEGLVSSDYVAVEMLSTVHHLPGGLEGAAIRALDAGVDQELPGTAAYGEPLRHAVESGAVAESAVDAAVSRVLTAKFELGLFDHPYVDVPSEDALSELVREEARVAHELARRSLVLLHNDGVLPLSASLGTLAVVGPLADSARDLLGDYSHLLHIETLVEMRSSIDNAFGFPIDERTTAADELAGRQTILGALRERLSGVDIRYERGCGLRDGTDEELAAAVEAARGAEVALVVLGERSGLTDDSTTGEFRDRVHLGFMGRQQELLEAVVATGTPVVLLVVSGRPLILEWASRHCAAILLAWVPGDAGPQAIADALAGIVSPGGKLPVTLPRHVGQLPLYYGHKPSGGRSHPKTEYVDATNLPLFPFGYGLSYTSFEIGDLALSAAEVPLGGSVDISVTVANTGQRRGDEVVQLYLRDVEASVTRPVLELRGFRRVTLDPGERRRLTFHLGLDQLCFTGLDGRLRVEPGEFEVLVGSSSQDLPVRSVFRATGEVRTLDGRHRSITRVSEAAG
jgi:beta-glucosidase